MISRRMTLAERNYTIKERELLAIVYALEKWYPLLEGPHCTIHHKPELCHTTFLSN